MSTALSLLSIETFFRKWGVKYDVFPGAATRGRGPLNPIGIGNHHTGSDSGQSPAYDTWIFTEGRPAEGIPAPLCNFTVDMDGDCHIGALGRANHFGSGSSVTREHVRNEDYDGYHKELKPGPDNYDDANGMFYGFEFKYDGGQPMTQKMFNTGVRANAAICDAYGWSALRCIGHKEHTTRKSDPGHLFMPTFRITVNQLLALDGADMQLSDPVGNIKDPDGSPLVTSEALIRGNWAYMKETGQLEAYNVANGRNPDGTPKK